MDPPALAYYLTLIPSIVMAITIHEWAHAWTALQCGDTTAYQAGRVTLNPLAHLDPLGTLLFFLAGFGWGKSTPVNVNAMRHPRANLVVSAAGPLSNLLLAALAGFVFRAPGVMAWLDALGAGTGARLFVSVFVYMNLILAFFNLLPIWPLDGSHVVENLLPVNQAFQFKRFGMAYGTFILLGIILLGRLTGFSILRIVLDPPINFFSSLFLGT